jgi:hypothetical protein
MGQYYRCFNLTKKEYIDPLSMGDGDKLLEFGTSCFGTMTGLAVLLADGNDRSGGDLLDPDPVSEKIIGSWAGDNIVIAGNHADNGKFITKKNVKRLLDKNNNPLNRERICLYNLSKRKGSPYKDISNDVLFAIMADEFIRQHLTEQEQDVIKDFSIIHEHYKQNPENMVLLVGRLKTNEGKTILEKFLKNG